MESAVGRRQCLVLLGGALAWPFAAPAQPVERVRRIGVLIYGSEDNRASQAQAASLQEGLKELGWVEGRNLRIDLRFEADPKRIHVRAEELVGSAPDVIVVNTGTATRALQQLTRTIPIVFAGVGDPAASGLVASLGRPGGNITGITNLFFSVGGKWLELLREIAPRLERTAIVFNPEFNTNEGWFAAVEAAAPILGVTVGRVPIRNLADIERAIDTIAAVPNGGLILVPPGLVGAERDLMLRMAVERRLPAIYPSRTYSIDGGLMSYGPDSADQFRLSASYVDRILRGAKPGELPVQFPTKFELVINRATAKAVGLDVPPMLIARADELIE
jgi:putative ABC transport system substrate-binding protein